MNKYKLDIQLFAEEKKVKRSQFATFLNTSAASTEVWSRMGKGISSQEVAYNANTEETQFIDEDNGTTELNGYAPSIATTQTAYVGNPVFDFVDGLRRKRAIGSDAETDLLLVYLYDKQADDAYPAEKQRVVITIESFGGDATAPTSITYNVGFSGDPTEGAIAIASDGKVTFTAKS